MERDTVGMVLASVLAGLAALLVVVALARQPFLLPIAVPFAAGAYLVWRGATGRFSFGLTGGRFREARPGADRRGADRRGADPRGPFRQAREGGPFRQARGGGGRGARQRDGGRRRSRDPTGDARNRAREALDRREAYRVLGLSPGADAATVKAAYRRKVKAVHPDADGGDPEAFRKVTAAYETLRE